MTERRAPPPDEYDTTGLRLGWEVVLVLSLGLTLVLGLKLFGVY